MSGSSYRFAPVWRVKGRGASLEGDQVCAARERAITQQPADRGGIDVVGASDISVSPPASRRNASFAAAHHSSTD